MKHVLKTVRRRGFRTFSDVYLSNVVVQDLVERQQFFNRAFSALTYNGIDGDYAEFGCFGGITFDFAHKEARRHGHAARLWAFDSFDGLPPVIDVRDEHPNWDEGAMAMSVDEFHTRCHRNGIPRDSYECVEGYYDESLPALGDGEPTNIALAYIDCDLYSSTASVLEFLEPRLKHGMILAFDDYFCWSSKGISGEREALEDFLSRQSNWTVTPYQQFAWAGKSFVVERVR